MKKKIALIICYFGRWPPWINIFIHTCKSNAEIDFLLFSDCGGEKIEGENVQYIEFSLDKFNRLASAGLGMQIQITETYKLCDFKPAYGIIFQEYLEGYDLWGHTDVDLVFGNIKSFVTDDVLDTYDIITAKQQYLVGHFTLYKNLAEINSLFTQSRDHIKIFTTPNKIYSFDECSFLWFPLLKGVPISEMETEFISMTHVVKSLEQKNNIKAYFKTHVIEQDQVDENFMLVPFKDTLAWDHGRLTNLSDETECMYFHFHFMKLKPWFKVPNWNNIPSKFYISEKGFFV